MARMVSRQPLTAKFRVRSQGSPRGVCGGQSVTGTEAQYFGFLLSAFHQCCLFVIQHRCCVFLAMNTVCTYSTLKGASLSIRMLFSNTPHSLLRMSVQIMFSNWTQICCCKIDHIALSVKYVCILFVKW